MAVVYVLCVLALVAVSGYVGHSIGYSRGWRDSGEEIRDESQ